MNERFQRYDEPTGKFVEGDIFCSTCGDKIDHIIVKATPFGTPDGMALALLISDSKQMHKIEKNCFGIGWKEGEWKDKE